MSLLFDPEAMSEIPHSDTARITEKIDWLWQNRDNLTHIPLSHNLSNFFKRRFGKYRIIYSYGNNSSDMIIHLVGLRDTIYQDAAKKLG
jgi:mRNA-degrading endonuclease RelE of RelBE toxin-antitoxin system